MFKNVAFILALALPTVSFAAVSPEPVAGEDTAHGGGCRKDSPAGQCCHAGSEPYHCH